MRSITKLILQFLLVSSVTSTLNQTYGSEVINLINTGAESSPGELQRESTIAVIDQNVVSVFVDESGGFNSIGGQRCGWAQSFDGGNSWSLYSSNIKSTYSEDSVDPVIAADIGNKKFYLLTLKYAPPPNPFTLGRFGLAFWEKSATSTSWTGPFEPLPYFSSKPMSIDKPWMAVDNNSGNGQGNIAFAYKISEGDESDTDVKVGSIYLGFKTAGSSVWTPSQLPNALVALDTDGSSVEHRLHGPQVVFTSNHNFYVFWLDNNDSDLSIKFQRYDKNAAKIGGIGTATTLYIDTENGDLGLDYISKGDSFPRVAAAGNSLYLVYNDKGVSTDKGDIFFTKSTDYGATWTTPMRVNTDIGYDAQGQPVYTDQWQPVIATKPGGSQVFVGWYSRENNPSTKKIDVIGRKAFIEPYGSLVWEDPFKINETSFDGGDTNRTINIHDYDGACADKFYFYYSWSDRSQYQTRKEDIYNAVIPAHPHNYYVFDGFPIYPTTVATKAYGINNLSNPNITGFYTDPYNYGCLGNPYWYDTITFNETTYGRGINDNNVVTGYMITQLYQWIAFRRLSDGTLVNLNHLSSTPMSAAYDINNSGNAVGVSFKNSYQEASVLWEWGTTTPINMGTLRFDSSGQSAGFGINEFDQITGSADRYNSSLQTNVRGAFRTDPGEVFIDPFQDYIGTLGQYGYNMSEGYDINDIGWVVGHSERTDGYVHGFICPPGTAISSSSGDLGSLEWNRPSVAYSINNSNVVVGTGKDSLGTDRALIYYHGMDQFIDMNTLIDPQGYGYGWELEVAYRINNSGVITGQGKYFGEPRAFIAYPMD